MSNNFTIKAENALNRSVKIAEELGNPKVLNSAVLGLAAKHIGFTEEEWLSVLVATVPQKTVDINVKAFKAGYEV